MTAAVETTPSLDTVLAALEKAAGASRELDVLVYSLFVEPGKIGMGGKTLADTIAAHPGQWSSIADWWDGVMPSYSASLDAALALVEEKLPGWFWEVGNNIWEGSPVGQAELFTPDAETVGQFRAATPALAVLVSLFKALTDGSVETKRG